MQPGEWHRLSAGICAESPVLSGLLQRRIVIRPLALRSFQLLLPDGRVIVEHLLPLPPQNARARGYRRPSGGSVALVIWNQQKLRSLFFRLPTEKIVLPMTTHPSADANIRSASMNVVYAGETPYLSVVPARYPSGEAWSDQRQYQAQPSSLRDCADSVSKPDTSEHIEC